MSEETAIPMNLTTKADLYRAYLPFTRRGGLFIATHQAFHLGDEVLVLLQLLDEAEQFPIVGRVIWITPFGAQGGIKAGIGIEFANEEAQIVNNKIMAYLAGMRESTAPTETM